MNKLATIFCAAIGLVLISAVSAMAQEAAATGAAAGAAAAHGFSINLGGAFGAAFTTIGAAYGISKLASSALEGMARQPEVAGSIQTAMIIAAALIEGFTFYALFICSTMK